MTEGDPAIIRLEVVGHERVGVVVDPVEVIGVAALSFFGELLLFSWFFGVLCAALFQRALLLKLVLDLVSVQLKQRSPGLELEVLRDRHLIKDPALVAVFLLLLELLVDLLAHEVDVLEEDLVRPELFVSLQFDFLDPVLQDLPRLGYAKII